MAIRKCYKTYERVHQIFSRMRFFFHEIYQNGFHQYHLIIKNIIGNLNFKNIIKYIDYHQANMKPLVLEPCNLEIMSTLTLRYDFNFRVENYLGKIFLFTQEIKLRPTLRTNRFNVFQPNQIHIYFWHILNSNLNN